MRKTQLINNQTLLKYAKVISWQDVKLYNSLLPYFDDLYNILISNYIKTQFSNILFSKVLTIKSISFSRHLTQLKNYIFLLRSNYITLGFFLASSVNIIQKWSGWLKGNSCRCNFFSTLHSEIYNFNFGCIKDKKWKVKYQVWKKNVLFKITI